MSWLDELMDVLRPKRRNLRRERHDVLLHCAETVARADTLEEMLPAHQELARIGAARLDPYGVWRSGDKPTLYNVWLGNTHGLWTFTMERWGRSDVDESDYRVIMGQYRAYLYGLINREAKEHGWSGEMAGAVRKAAREGRFAWNGHVKQTN